MSENVGSVFWEVEVDARGMLRSVRQIDQRLDDLNSNLNETSQGIRRAFNPARIRALAGGVAKAVGAATVAFTAFAAAIGTSAKELEVMARQAGVTIEQFQAIQFATEKYTVTGEQFADITKDMSDKLGEFASVGTGPFQDYVDVMKLTSEQGAILADQLQHLAGPQAIQFLVSEMQKAEISGAQMTFVLESMGNDLSKLIPLFSDNGAELDKLTKKFEQLSGGIDADTFREYKELSGNMGLATTSFKTFLAEALSPLIPAFNDASISIAAFFSEMTKGVKESKDAQAANQRVADIIGEQLDRRGRVVKVASKEAQELDKLIKRNEELNEKINQRITATGRSAALAKKRQKENAAAWAAEIKTNETRINQLKEESAAALEVFNIRNKIATTQPAATGGGGSAGSQTPFAPIDFGGGGDRVSQAGGVQEGEFGSFGAGNPFNVQVINDDSEEILGILRRFKNQRDSILNEGESPAERERRLYAERLMVITEAEAILGEKNAEIMRAKEEAHANHEARMTQISKDEQKNRLMSAQNQLQGWGDFFGAMTELSEAQGRQSFKTWKKFAMAQAAISTALAIVNASTLTPWPAAVVAMAAAGISGAAQIAKINSTSYSGRAQGGVVKAGNTYPVNEAGIEGFQFRSGGKEYLRPMTNGRVVKSSDMNKGGVVQQNANITIQVSTLDASDFNTQIARSEETVYNTVAKVMREQGKQL
jgi:hypothetical protein